LQLRKQDDALWQIKSFPHVETSLKRGTSFAILDKTATGMSGNKGRRRASRKTFFYQPWRRRASRKRTYENK